MRRPLLLRVDVEVAGRDGVVPGQIVDVSGSGCRIELKQPLEKGNAVRLTLYGVEGSIDLSLAAEVRWQRVAPDGTQVAGVKFTGTAAVLAGRLLGHAVRPRLRRAYGRRRATWLACWRAWRWSLPCMRTTRHISMSRERRRWPIRSTRNSRRRSGSAASASSRVTSW